MKNRIWWIESLRAIAMLMVIVPHFIAAFCPDVFQVWETHSWALKGISGKHGVAIFCVLIGYFSSRVTEKGLPCYTLQRYLQFFINIALVIIPYTIVLSGWNNKEILNGIIQSVLFRDDIVPTFWCVMAMFEGSILCFILGNYCRIKNRWLNFGFLLAVCFFLKYIDVWLAICVLGVIMRTFQSISFKNKSKVAICIVFACFIPILYRHPESNMTYFMQGCACFLLLYICFCISQLSSTKKWKGLIVLPFIGNISFYMFLWHTPVNMILKTAHFEHLNMYLLFCISFIISLLLSLLQYWTNIKLITPLIKRIEIETI